MIVCHCRGVSDRRVRRAVRQGAATRRAVARECGATSCCGGCDQAVEQIIDEERARETERATPLFVEVAAAAR